MTDEEYLDSCGGAEVTVDMTPLAIIETKLTEAIARVHARLDAIERRLDQFARYP